IMVPLDVPAFVVAWTALYVHFDAISYIPPDYIIYPPFSPPLLALQDQVNIHPVALKLLSQIPHPASYNHSNSFEILTRTHEWIAFEANTEGGTIESCDPNHARLKKTLTDVFGWPHAFRKDDWIREREGLLYLSEDELEL
ncbi:uncharacterized protein TRUGW13939_03303, partial [Talaromyces rugulosus]